MSTPTPFPPGTRFGRWVVLAEVDRPGSGYRWYRSRCDCGTVREVVSTSLKHGRSLSCGCLSRERSGRPARHGQTGSPTWLSWRGMVQACTDPKHKRWAANGGRGVTVDPRWLPVSGGSFENFVQDVGVKPSWTKLARIDRARSWERGNVAWRPLSETPRKRGRFA